MGTAEGPLALSGSCRSARTAASKQLRPGVLPAWNRSNRSSGRLSAWVLDLIRTNATRGHAWGPATSHVVCQTDCGILVAFPVACLGSGGHCFSPAMAGWLTNTLRSVVLPVPAGPTRTLTRAAASSLSVAAFSSPARPSSSSSAPEGPKLLLEKSLPTWSVGLSLRRTPDVAASTRRTSAC